MAASLHGDVASAIGQQVEQMILGAKKDSEARVRHDLSVARTQLKQMEGMIDQLSERVGRCARANGAGAPDPSLTVDRAFLSQKIQQLEQKWGSEVKALKQDLHRTILAHNHNSDLMRHHRDALDEARKKLDAHTQPKAEQVDAQIEKVDRMLRAAQAKQRALDALTDRLATLEQQASTLEAASAVGDVLPNASMTSPFPGMVPGMPGMNPMMGVPPATVQTRDPAPKRPTKKDGEPPTDEELHARLLQATQAAKAGAAAGGTFNAEAPVFVPRAASASEAGATTTTAATGDTAGPAPVKLEMPAGLSIEPVATVAEDGEAEGEAAEASAPAEGEAPEATAAETEEPPEAPAEEEAAAEEPEAKEAES